jgi:hypothetical protein
VRDLDESWVVEAVTWSLYLGFLSVPVAAALYYELEPLVTVQGSLPGVWGTVAAMGVGLAFLLAVRVIIDRIRGARAATQPSPTAPAQPPADPTPKADERGRSKRKRKRKKKKRT